MDGYEIDTTTFLLRLYKARSAFLDIGANIGLISIPFSLLAARSSEAGNGPCGPTTFCLEPVLSTFDALKHNIQTNECEHVVRPLCCAVGESEKDVDIQVEGNLRENEGTGTANILPKGSNYECERIPLHVTTVDRLIASEALPANISLVKIDVDGYDLFALMGAARLLEVARPLVFGEFMAHCMAWHGQSVDDVARFIEPLNYSAFMRMGRTWRFGPILERQYAQDLLLVPNERRSEVAWCLD